MPTEWDFDTAREPAPAKVNLTLAVRGRRPDGYHELESLVVFAGIGDEVRLRPGAEFGVSVTGPFASAIDGENLVVKAALLVRAAAPSAHLGRFGIDKRLPVAAGLGGGSADAAAALRLLRRLNPELADLDWPGLAASVGADVPVCLAGRPAVMWGIGERLLPLARPLPPAAMVLVNPLRPVPAGKTAAVFRALGAPALDRSALSGSALDEPAPLPPLSTLDDLARLIRQRGNALEPAARALMPAIAEVLAALAAEPACLAWSLSGGGPSCFGLFADAAAADAAAARLTIAEPGWWVKPAALLA